MREIPLLDGRVLDLDQTVDAHPSALSNDGTVVLRASKWFHAGQLPPWLSYATDNGPANPTFNSDGGVTLETGAINGGDDTWLTTTTGYNWDAWTAVRFYVTNFSIDNTNTAGAMTFADAPHPGDVSDGFHFAVYESGGGLANVQRIHNTSSGLVREQRKPHDGSVTSSHSFGARIEEHELGSGHTAFWTVDAEPWDAWPENEGFPSATARNFHVAARTIDGNAAGVTFDDLIIELVR